MDVEPLPTVEQLTAWMRIGHEALELATKLAADAYAIRQALAGVYTSLPVGVYLHGCNDATAICLPEGASKQDLALVKLAVSGAKALGPISEAEAMTGDWVKIAYSPTLRRAGELLNFFPGKYPGGIPNAPSPVTAMLTSGLVGAGLGYGTGYLAEQMFPQSWRRGRLRKTLGALGGMAGAAPGLIWGMTNRNLGNEFNDPSLLSQPPGTTPRMHVDDLAGLLKESCDRLPFELGPRYRDGCARVARGIGEDFDGLFKEAWNETFGDNERRPAAGSLAVNIDAMGRTLWDSGASPQLAGATMGALAAAQQMPGGEEVGFVTPAQMGNLAAHMGAGYVSGAIVGAALGLLTGLPEKTQDTLKRTGMYLGVVRAVVPRLFSQ